MRTVVAALLLAAALPLRAATLPSEISAQYDVMALGMKVGRVTETFARKDGRYTIESVTRSEGALKLMFDDQVRMESRGRVVAAGLRPDQFEQHRAKDGRRDIEATFDWTRGVLVSKVGGETHEVALPAQTQDRLSLMYQFMHLTPEQGSLAVTMSNGRKVETYAYRFVERVRIATPAGDFDTLHYARVTTGNESRADVWLAPDRFNFPVRIVFDNAKGLRLEQTLVSLQSR